MDKQRVRLLYILTKPETLRFLRGQVGYIRERGFDVHVITSPGTELDDFAGTEEVSADSVVMTRQISPIQDLRSFWAVLKHIRRLRPDVIHASTPKAALLGIVSAKLTKVPVKIFLLRNLQLSTTSAIKRPLVRITYQITAYFADQVLAVSHSLRDLAAKERICAHDRVRVLMGGSSNGVDAIGKFNPERFSKEETDLLRKKLGLPDDCLVIGFVGRLATIKGLVELAAAWRTLTEQRSDIRLLLLGRFDDNYSLPAKVRSALEGDPTVHLTGQVPETAAYFRLMDVVVLPSYREGLPNALLEAAAMELPVVTTRALGCVDAIEDGVTGKLIPLADADSLASAIAEYCEHPTLRHQHGIAGRKRVLREFQQQPIWEANYQELVRLLRSKGIAPPRAQDRGQTSLGMAVNKQRVAGSQTLGKQGVGS